MQVVTILGSNSGDKYRLMEQAISLLAKKAGKKILASSYYETAPWGFECEENFLNRVVVFETELSAESFLQAALEVERQLGRIRSADGPRYDSRPIDIDMLFYGTETIDTPTLTIPHPRLEKRNFVLTPLREILPGFIHPVLHKSIQTLWETCPDGLEVRKIEASFPEEQTKEK